MIRTHTCGDLKKDDIGKFVILQGWVNTSRNHGGIIFINLRDRYGITQTIIHPSDEVLFSKAEEIRKESVIEIHGEVIARAEGMSNPSMTTGDIEVEVKDLKVLGDCAPLPMELDETSSDEMRMKYRYLDLRRPVMQKRLITRHKVSIGVRKQLSDLGFIEIETPLFVKSTPEGARDYVVPSRVNPGKFYALPQSPQIYKQILMVSGFDRYFQLARCFRDEDLRADRQPDFTQIDIEMSFPTLEDLWTILESVVKSAFKAGIGVDIPTPFTRIPYEEAMSKYGCDKPDIRFDLFLKELTEIAGESEFGVFKSVIESGGIVKCVTPEADFSRKDIDKYTEFAKNCGAAGLVWMKVTENGLEGSVAKFFNENLQKKLIDSLDAKPGMVIFAVAGKKKMVNDVLYRLRNKLGEDLKLYDPREFGFCWIKDFPLFEWNEEDEKWEPAHHMFCMPMEEDLQHLETDPGKVHCTQYDLVLNGVELGSGSIRINKADIQERVMKVIGLTIEELRKKFGFMLESFRYGAPPHGGFAFGFDRLVALMQGVHDIREVIAFPKNKSAQSPIDGSPSELSKKQLKELSLQLDIKKS